MIDLIFPEIDGAVGRSVLYTEVPLRALLGITESGGKLIRGLHQLLMGLPVPVGHLVDAFNFPVNVLNKLFPFPVRERFLLGQGFIV